VPSGGPARRGPFAAVALGFLLFGLAWAFTNPVSAAPDEPTTLVKTAATGHGQFAGRPAPDADRRPPSRRTRWLDTVARSFDLPAALRPPYSIPCYAFNPARTADCDRAGRSAGEAPVPQVSLQGPYPPFLYLPGGVATRLAGSYDSAVRAARVGQTLTTSALLAAAVLVAAARRDRRRAAMLAGLLVAVSPMVLYLGATVSTAGVEVAAAVTFWAALLALADRDESTRCRRVGWLVAGVAGSVLALSRLLDPAFIVVAVLVAWLLAGGRPRWPAAGAVRWGPLAATVAVAVSCAVTLAWDVFVMPHPALDPALLASDARLELARLPDVVQQAVGVFGWVDTVLPSWALLVWAGCAAVPLAVALAIGRWRGRLAVLLTLGSALAGYLALAVLQRQIGFGMQMRFVLPLVAGLPLVAAEVAGERVRPQAAWLAVRVAAVAVASVHLAAVVVNLHRYAAGAGAGFGWPWPAGWDPPGGRLSWLALAAASAALLAVPAVASPATAGRRRRTGAGIAGAGMAGPDGSLGAGPPIGTGVDSRDATEGAR
jgi:hypothetical protein